MVRTKGIEEFPTCVGMNRYAGTHRTSDTGVPHMRGDEPQMIADLDAILTEFPTCVGMNRSFLFWWI